MNIKSLLAVALLPVSITAWAGSEMSSGKEYKDNKVIAPTPCFKDREFQLDLFGAYVDGNALDHAGPWQDHGWGGGIGLNYFFTRYIGVGIEGSALYGRENRQRDDRGNDLSRAKHTTVYSGSGSLIFRMPIESICLAPYAYLGGGISVDGDKWAAGFGGVGVEYRVVPERVSLFMDGRCTYYGDRYDHGDQNNYTGKAGIRFIF
jgi:hypothetical protein